MMTHAACVTAAFIAKEGSSVIINFLNTSEVPSEGELAKDDAADDFSKFR
jgi:hypothetical protein